MPDQYKTSEDLDVKCTNTSKPPRVIIIYRSLKSSIPEFLDELSPYLREVATAHENLVIVGDLNLHYGMDSATSVNRLEEMLVENDLEQRVPQLTHKMGHTLALVITEKADSILSSPDVYHSAISDHRRVVFNVVADMPQPPHQVQTVQDVRGLDKAAFALICPTNLVP